MVTLEDLEGSVQVLCMNENYDKYRELLMPNKAILVIGEVNTGDDKPKIFPQEIMPLEDAPATIHQAGPSAPAHGALEAGTTGIRSANWSPRIRANARCSSAFMRPTGEVVFRGNPREVFGHAVAGIASRPPTSCSARKPITPRWTPACRNARRAAGNAGLKMVMRGDSRKSEGRNPKAEGSPKPEIRSSEPHQAPCTRWYGARLRQRGDSALLPAVQLRD